MVPRNYRNFNVHRKAMRSICTRAGSVSVF